jgi:hypothetical protein
MTSSVSVGRIWSWPFLMKELFDESVVISNSPLLKNNCQNPLTE